MRSSITLSGAGNAPARSTTANRGNSSRVNPPEMTALPPVIADLRTGAEYSTLSRIIAKLRPTLSEVIV